MPHRILVVEDEPDLMRAIVLRLQAAGFVCETAVNGHEGLQKARAQAPDLVVTDLLMDDLDGYDFCRQLRADRRCASVPILVLTVVKGRLLGRRAEDQEPVDHDRSKRLAGASRILHKPFDSEVLLQAVRDLLNGRRTRWRSLKRS